MLGAPPDSKNPPRRARSGAGAGTCNPQIPDFSDDATTFAQLALHSFLSIGPDSLRDLGVVDPPPYPLPVVRGEVKESALVVTTHFLTAQLDCARQTWQYHPALRVFPRDALISVTPPAPLALKGRGLG